MPYMRAKRFKRSNAYNSMAATKRQYRTRIGRVLPLSTRRQFQTPSRINPTRELRHKHVLNLLSSQPANWIGLRTDASGLCEWISQNGAVGPSLSFMFSLSKTIIYVQGGPAVEIPTPGVDTLLAMYDSYQIDKIDIEMYVGQMVTQDSQSGGGNVLFQPIILMSPDTEDSAVTSLDQLLQYSTTTVVQPLTGKPVSISIKPSCSSSFNADPNAVGTAGVGRKFSPTLAIATPSVAHYGLKMASDMGRARTGGVNLEGVVTFRIRLHTTMIGTR